MNIRIMLVRKFIFAVLLVQAKPEGDASTPSSLRLEMKLRKQSYCLRADRMNLSFDLQLRFINTGEEPLIIYRKCDRPLKVNRSATASDALAGKFEESLEITPDFFYPHLV